MCLVISCFMTLCLTHWITPSVPRWSQTASNGDNSSSSQGTVALESWRRVQAADNKLQPCCMMRVNINFYDILFLYRRNYTLYNSSWRINSWLWSSWRQFWQVGWWWWWGVWRPGSWLIQEWDITELTDISDISSRHAIKQSINNNN